MHEYSMNSPTPRWPSCNHGHGYQSERTVFLTTNKSNVVIAKISCTQNTQYTGTLICLLCVPDTKGEYPGGASSISA